jgi:hypothetical protein
MTESSQRRSAKMASVFGRLRDRRQTERGDFIRPRSIPLDVWKRMVPEARRRAIQRGF